jgi:hypothetical protein
VQSGNAVMTVKALPWRQVLASQNFVRGLARKLRAINDRICGGTINTHRTTTKGIPEYWEGRVLWFHSNLLELFLEIVRKLLNLKRNLQNKTIRFDGRGPLH